jgi:hypothetical protein
MLHLNEQRRSEGVLWAQNATLERICIITFYHRSHRFCIFACMQKTALKMFKNNVLLNGSLRNEDALKNMPSACKFGLIQWTGFCGKSWAFLESWSRQISNDPWCQDVTPTWQLFFSIVTSLVYGIIWRSPSSKLTTNRRVRTSRGFGSRLGDLSCTTRHATSRVKHFVLPVELDQRDEKLS